MVGSTRLRDRLSRAKRGRQASPPRPKISTITGQSSRASASSGGVFRMATVRGRQNLRKKLPLPAKRSCTVASGPAQARRRAAK